MKAYLPSNMKNSQWSVWGLAPGSSPLLLSKSLGGAILRLSATQSGIEELFQKMFWPQKHDIWPLGGWVSEYQTLGPRKVPKMTYFWLWYGFQPLWARMIDSGRCSNGYVWPQWHDIWPLGGSVSKNRRNDTCCFQKVEKRNLFWFSRL